MAAVDELSGSGLVMCSEERHEEGLEASVAMSWSCTGPSRPLGPPAPSA